MFNRRSSAGICQGGIAAREFGRERRAVGEPRCPPTDSKNGRFAYVAVPVKSTVSPPSVDVQMMEFVGPT
jgi:hypothetical protein